MSHYPPPPPAPTVAPAHFSSTRRGGNRPGGRGRGRGRGSNPGSAGGPSGGFNHQPYPAAGPQPQQFHPPYPVGYPQFNSSANAYGYGYGYQAPFQTPGQFAYPPHANSVPPMPQTYTPGTFQPQFPQAAAPPPANFPSFGAGPIRMGFDDRHARPNPNAYHGQKRKRDAQPPKVKTGAAPAVPSFGTNLSLPPKPPAPAQQDGNGFKKKKKKNKGKGKGSKRRRLNQLGLTPKVEDGDEDSDEEMDEEQLFAKQMIDDGEGYVRLVPLFRLHTNMHCRGPFYNESGIVIAVDSPDAIKAWVAERKKRYPTKANIAARATLAALLGPKSQDSSKTAETVKAKEDSNGTAKLEPLVKYDSGPEDEETGDKGQLEALAAASDTGSAPDELPMQIQDAVMADSEKTTQKERPFCLNWLKDGNCTRKVCKFKHGQPTTDTNANTDSLNSGCHQHQTLHEQFVESESLQKAGVALGLVRYLAMTGFPGSD